MAQYRTGTGDKKNCVYKVTKEGKLGAEVGCNRKQIKERMKGLYEYDTSAASNALKEIAKAYEIGQQHNTYLDEIEQMKNELKSHYENMTHENYEDTLKEIKKSHDDLASTYANVRKLVDTNK